MSDRGKAFTAWCESQGWPEPHVHEDAQAFYAGWDAALAARDAELAAARAALEQIAGPPAIRRWPGTEAMIVARSALAALEDDPA